MKPILKHFLLVVCFALSAGCFAQQHIALNDVQKINVIDASGGFGTPYTNNYEIVNNNGKWFCYRTSWSGTDNPGAQKQTPHFKKLIKEVNPARIEVLLNTLNIIKPVFDWKAFNITPESLRNYVDKSPNKDWRIEKWGNQLKKYYNDSTLKVAIEELQHDGWTDDYPFCAIDIVEKNKDTVKIESNRQGSYMLPWKINGTSSYDVGINKFFIDILDTEVTITNKERISGTGFPRQVQEYIYTKFAQKNIEYADFFYDHPENLALLKSNFKVSYTGSDNGGYRCYLTNDAMPGSMTMNAVVNIADKHSIERLIRHRDSIINAVKLNNFVFDYYSKIPKGHISFPWQFDFTTKSYIVEDVLRKRLPVLDNFDLSKAIFFRVNAEHTQSEWLLLGDNKLVLLEHYGDKIANIPAGILGQQLNGQIFATNTSVYFLFNADGKLLSSSKR